MLTLNSKAIEIFLKSMEAENKDEVEFVFPIGKSNNR